MKFAICNEIFQGWPLAKTFDYARQAGYDAVEIAPFTLAKSVLDIPAEQRRQIRDLARTSQIAISGIHWVLAHTDGFYITSPDPATRARTARYFVSLIEFCADLGGKFLILGSPKQRDLAPGISMAQGLDWTREVLGDAIRRAEDLGITVCFEPLGPTETNFVNTADEAIAFTRAWNSPALKVILDVKAMSSMGKPIPTIIREAKGEFAYFHANDANLKGPGFGAIDFVPIGNALREVGYHGYVSVEVFNFDEGPEVIATQSRANLRRDFGE